MKQPEEMPEKLCTKPIHAFDGGWIAYDESKVIGAKGTIYIRADLAAKPDKVDVEALKRKAGVFVDETFPNNPRSINTQLLTAIRLFIDHLYSRNLIPPVEPVRGDECNKKEEE